MPKEAKPKPERNTTGKNSFGGHLKELRKVIIVSACAIGVGFLIVFIGFSEQLILFFSRTLADRNIQIINTGVAEVFRTQALASFVAGIVIAAPVVFWQIWSFLKPALYPKEQTTFRLVFLIICALFITGVLFAYLLVFNIAVNFFILTGENIAVPMISIAEYIRMLFAFVIPFGLIFQMPVVITMLLKLGIVTCQGLVKGRKYVIFFNFLIAAILTPPDIVTQLMLSLPMCLLYEICIFISRGVSFVKREDTEDNDKAVEASG